ncbi:kinase [Glaciecola sp. 1036]|uniref:kinase n=1 Tax=Alteromonadaceae TaxID=72275 RepID=UPI003D07AAE5
MQQDEQDSILAQFKEQFTSEHKLTNSYWQSALKWFKPLADDIISHHKKAKRPLFVGVNGAQGSGKSTLTDFLVGYFNQVQKVSSVGFSIDDFYFSKEIRAALSEQVHPLLHTRGVPGTHNAVMLNKVLNKLALGQSCIIPKFDKANDDLYPEEDWTPIEEPKDIIVFEGWCVGSKSAENDTLSVAVNPLETEHDPDGSWRGYVNQQLLQKYEPIFARLDLLVMLKAPSFNTVYSWRLEQEHKLKQKLAASGITGNIGMTDEEIKTFIQYYQRITEHNLHYLPADCDYVFSLDEKRSITQCIKK